MERRLQLLWNGVPDDGDPKPALWFQNSINFALLAFVQEHAKVYVHCAAGVNRGPSTCYAILRAVGFERADAERLIRAKRPIVRLAYIADADRAVELFYG